MRSLVLVSYACGLLVVSIVRVTECPSFHKSVTNTSMLARWTILFASIVYRIILSSIFSSTPEYNSYYQPGIFRVAWSTWQFLTASWWLCSVSVIISGDWQEKQVKKMSPLNCPFDPATISRWIWEELDLRSLCLPHWPKGRTNRILHDPCIQKCNADFTDTINYPIKAPGA